MEFLIIIAVVVGSIIIGVTKNRAEETNRAWSKVASKLGLSLIPATWKTPPLMTGTVTGHALTVDIRKKASGRHKAPWTEFQVALPSLPMGLRLKSEGFFDGISKAFGATDIETGDAEFDNLVLVNGRDATAVREFLTPKRRRVIRNFLRSFSGAVISDNGISWASRGYARKDAEMLAAIDAMLLVARALTEAQEAEAVTLPEYRPYYETGPATIDTEPVAAFATADGIDAAAVDRAATSPPALEKIAAGALVTGASAAALDAALDGPSDGATAGAPDVAPDESPDGAARGEADGAAPNEPDGAADGVPDIAAFCGEIFAPGALSFAATQKFNERFRTQRVTWSGTLESASPYRFDFDFGSQGGVKAVLTILSQDERSFSARDVKAVIGLPAGTGGLEDRIGQRVTFAGTLLKVDGFGRKVYLSDAELGD